MKSSYYSEFQLRQKAYQPVRLTLDGKRDRLGPTPVQGVLANSMALVTMHYDTFNALCQETDAYKRDEWLRAPAIAAGTSVIMLFKGAGEIPETQVGEYSVVSYLPAVPGFESLERYLVVPPSLERTWINENLCRFESLPLLPKEIAAALDARATA